MKLKAKAIQQFEVIPTSSSLAQDQQPVTATTPIEAPKTTEKTAATIVEPPTTTTTTTTTIFIQFFSSKRSESSRK